MVSHGFKVVQDFVHPQQGELLVIKRPLILEGTLVYIPPVSWGSPLFGVRFGSVCLKQKAIHPLFGRGKSPFGQA